VKVGEVVGLKSKMYFVRGGGGGVMTVSICICNLCLIFKNCVTKVMSKSPSRHLVRVHRK